MSYLVDIFNRMVNNKALTPAERAFLKALFGVFVGLAASIGPQLPDIVAGRAGFNVWLVVSVTAIVVVLLAVSKLWASTHDQAVGQLLDHYAEELLMLDEGVITTHQLPKFQAPTPDPLDISQMNTAQMPAVSNVAPTVAIPNVVVRTNTPPPAPLQGE